MSTQTLTTNANLTLTRNYKNQPDTDGPITYANANFMFADFLGYGSGSDQAKDCFHDIRTLTDSATDNLDLYGSLRNGFGNLISFTAIKFIGIKHLTAAGASLTIGGGTGPLLNWVAASGDQIRLRPGATMAWWSPKSGAAVTNSTAERLTIVNLGETTVQYEICIIGVT